LALLPDDARDRLKGATDALSSYGETLSAIIKLEKERAAAQSRVDTATARVSAAETNSKAEDDAVKRLRAQLAEYEELTKAIKEREAAERAYAEAEKELEKARRSGAGEKAIKSRKEKRSKAEQDKIRTEKTVTAIETELGEEKVGEYTKAVEALAAAIKKQKAAKAELEDATKAETAAQSALETV
jgi:colicin import membrane protein